MRDTQELQSPLTLAGARGWPRLAGWALLFVLIAAALAWAERSMLFHVNHEVGDFAANSLLIQDAKRLHLIHGNYSRIGFNHPGPAILYVLAFGELVFHDWLHLVPSPFSGQLVGGILYNTGWIVLVCALARRITGDVGQALLFTTVLVLGAAWIDHSIVNGLWFPHLYFFPYAAMLMAIAPLVAGRADALKALAVSSGFLINGHVSFVPMLGVTLVVVLAANTFATRHERANRILSRAWLSRHRRAIGVGVGILFLFFVPLLIATVTEWPGPVADYLRFGKQNKGNQWIGALKFVSMYWGSGKAPPWGLLVAAVLAALLLKDSRGAQGSLPFVRGARGLGVAFVATSLALLCYAKAGVDDLNQTYLAIFYYAVPPLCAGLVVLFACRAVRGKARNVLVGALTVALLGGAWHSVRETPDYAMFYDQPSVVDLYGKLKALPGAGRIVFDLKQDSGDWGVTWGNILGLQAYAKRQHDDLVCLNENWYTSNTRASQCRPDEVAHNRRYGVRQAEAPDPVRGEPDIDSDGMALYRHGAAPRLVSYVTVKDQPAYFARILGKGWSGLEPGFVWSDGPVAEINLPADPARARMMTMDFGSFVPNGHVELYVEALANGRPAGTTHYGFTETRHRFTIDLGAEPGAAQHIELKIATPTSPLQWGMSDDKRILGLQFYGIKKDIP